MINPLKAIETPTFIGSHQVGMHVEVKPAGTAVASKPPRDSIEASTKNNTTLQTARMKSASQSKQSGINPQELSRSKSQNPIDRQLIENLISQFYGSIRG